MIKTMTVHELKNRIDQGKKPLLLDVREEHELNIAQLDFDHHIPLGDLPDDYEKLSRDEELVVYCRSGGRSMKACELLEKKGFTDVTNLTGGVLAWADEIDPAMEKY
jgi:adenylyltransferase/sulfurtransferase